MGCINSSLKDVLLAVFFFIQGGLQLGLPFYFNKSNILVAVIESYPDGLTYNANTTYRVETLFSFHPNFFAASIMLITGCFHLIYAIILCDCKKNQFDKGGFSDSDESLSTSERSLLKNTALRVEENQQKKKTTNKQLKKEKQNNTFVIDSKVAWVSFIRWIEYSITATFMIVEIDVNCGINDLFSIIPYACCNFTMMLCGIVIDYELAQRNIKSNTVYYVYALGCVAGVAPWVGIFAKIGLLGTKIALPGIVMGITVVIFCFFSSFGIHACIYIYAMRNQDTSLFCGNVSAKTYIKQSENIYRVLSFTSKTVLSWLEYSVYII